MGRVTVEVTQADIDNGAVSDCIFCPVARAMERATGKLWVVLGTRCRPFAEDYSSLGATRWLPDAAHEFITAFDEGRPVEPFEFEIEL